MERELIQQKQMEKTKERLKLRRSKRKLQQSLGRERSLRTLIRKGSFKSIAKKIKSKRSEVVKAVVTKFDKNSKTQPNNTKVVPNLWGKFKKPARPPLPKENGKAVNKTSATPPPK